jgi:hypothetical protein
LADDAYGISQTLPDVTHRVGMPECVKTAYQSCRKVLVIDQILHPRLLDGNSYNTKVSGSISRDDAHFAAISKEMAEASIESALLVCGLENNAP